MRYYPYQSLAIAAFATATVLWLFRKATDPMASLLEQASAPAIFILGGIAILRYGFIQCRVSST